jgi:hypothetical protein
MHAAATGERKGVLETPTFGDADEASASEATMIGIVDAARRRGRVQPLGTQQRQSNAGAYGRRRRGISIEQQTRAWQAFGDEVAG